LLASYCINAVIPVKNRNPKNGFPLIFITDLTRDGNDNTDIKEDKEYV